MNLKQLLKTSRPRFWLYLAGTYLVGYTLGLNTVFDYNLEFVIYFLYFLIPANIFLYGINDYFDWDTDNYNPKKKEKESLLEKNQKKSLIKILLITIIISIILLIPLRGLTLTSFIIFLVLSTFYSMPPIRFKSKPIIDFSSNILYAMPAIFGYLQTGNTPSPLIIIALFFWTAAMHLYSAVPDIVPDKKAKLKTTAVILGKKTSLLLCLIFWLIVSIIIFKYSTILGLISLAYPVLVIITFFKDINKIYWYYPYINAIIGFIIYIYAVLIK